MPTKKIATAAILAAALSFGLAGAASAHSTKKVETELKSQASEIEAARLDGSLTKREYSVLKGQQARIAEMIEDAKSNGRVTERAVREIRAAQAEADRSISDDATNGKRNWLRTWLSNHR
jgi:septation ring formation regulator EzrA